MLILRGVVLILVVLAGYWAWQNVDPTPPPRPLLYEKGTYKGAPDAALEGDQVRLLQQRALRQKY